MAYLAAESSSGQFPYRYVSAGWQSGRITAIPSRPRLVTSTCLSGKEFTDGELSVNIQFVYKNERYKDTSQTPKAITVVQGIFS